MSKEQLSHNWTSEPLGNLFEIQLGKMLSRKAKKEIAPYPYLGNRNVQWGKVDITDLKTMDFNESERVKFNLKPNDLLVCEGGEVGRTAIWHEELSSCYFQKAIHRLRPKDAAIIDPSYTFRFMQFAAGRNLFARLTSKTSIAHLTKEKLSLVKIPLPPLAEQKRIAAILDKADGIRRKKQEILRLTDELLKSTFLEMFGDPVTNPKGWPVKTLGEVSESKLGKMLSKASKQEVNPVPYLANPNVQWRVFKLDNLRTMDFIKDELHKLNLINGDVLVCEGGEVGRCAIWRNARNNISFQKALHRVRVNEQSLTPEYLQEYLFWMALRGGLARSTSTATIAHLTGVKLKKLKIPLPPIELQRQFQFFYSRFEATLRNMNQTYSDLNDLFNSMVQQAFRGELSNPESTEKQMKLFKEKANTSG